MGQIESIAFSPNGRRIITGSNGPHIAKVWDAENGRELFTLKGYNYTLATMSVAFSPNGRRIVTGNPPEAMATVWDADDGSELFTLEGHTGKVMSVAFALDGRRIVTGASDNTAKVWNAETGRELLTLRGHSATSVAFSPDGRRIVTGSWDKTAKIWDADNGRELLVLKGHGSRINAVAVAPNGRRILLEATMGRLGCGWRLHPKTWKRGGRRSRHIELSDRRLSASSHMTPP